MLLIILLSVAVLIFVAGNAVRLIAFLRMPTPLRWELYPIPKGPRERQVYGGSYFEESDWWTKPQSTSHRGELVFMAKEVLFLKSVRDGFRSLWLWSLLLHWGLYLYATAGLSFIAGIWIEPKFLLAIAAALYGPACVLGLAGSLGLIFQRERHPRLRTYTSRATVFNLLLLGSLFATGSLSLPYVFSAAEQVVAFRAGSSLDLPFIVTSHLSLLALFLAYFPFTHMTHAYMKFFTWHGVRWDDAPAIADPAAARIAANLQREVTWAAPHISGDGQTTWSEVVVHSGGKGSAKRA